ITVPYGLMKRLTSLADRQSRSTSNCAAWLLEQALRELGAGADEISLQGALKALAAAGSGMVRSPVDPRGRDFVSP
ncbi:MAG: ribbon-helix-helix domain-containing protein, partial [Cyanobium sp.]